MSLVERNNWLKKSAQKLHLLLHTMANILPSIDSITKENIEQIWKNLSAEQHKTIALIKNKGKLPAQAEFLKWNGASKPKYSKQPYYECTMMYLPWQCKWWRAGRKKGSSHSLDNWKGCLHWEAASDIGRNEASLENQQNIRWLRGEKEEERKETNTSIPRSTWLCKLCEDSRTNSLVRVF